MQVNAFGRCGRSLAAAAIFVGLAAASDPVGPARAQSPAPSPWLAPPKPAPAGVQEAAAALDTADLGAAEDAWVSSARPGDNFGGDSRLYIGERPGYGATRTLVGFDMDDLDKGRAVTAVELVLENTGGGPAGDPARDVPIYRVDGSWSEGGVRWNNFPGSSGDRLATLAVGVSSGVYRWRSDKLTELVQRWRLPKWQPRHLNNGGLYVQGYETAGSHRAFGSSESSQRPKLRLTHERDTKTPLGKLNPVPRYFNGKTADGSTGRSKIKLSWTFDDPAPASGVSFFRLYSQRNGQPFVLEADTIEADTFELRGENGVEYGLVINAIDQAGNVEPQELAEVVTVVDHQAPQVFVQPLPPFSRGPVTLQIGGGDLPNGPGQVNSDILWYDIFYRPSGGAWAPLALQHGSTTLTVGEQLAEGVVYDFQARAFDKAENEQPIDPGGVQTLTAIDRRPPVVSFKPVPGVDNPRFTVQWAGVDPAPGSGVARYDVQYRIDSGPWQDWLANTVETSRVFDGAFSHVYSFRGRATDHVGNQGIYPTAAQLYVGVLDRDLFTHAIRLPWLLR